MSSKRVVAFLIKRQLSNPRSWPKSHTPLFALSPPMLTIILRMHGMLSERFLMRLLRLIPVPLRTALVAEIGSCSFSLETSRSGSLLKPTVRLFHCLARIQKRNPGDCAVCLTETYSTQSQSKRTEGTHRRLDRLSDHNSGTHEGYRHFYHLRGE